MKKILLLTSNTGGGHDMRARSFEQWCQHTKQFSTARHQALENSGSRLYEFGAWLYNFIQRTWPTLHHIYFNVLEVVPFCGSPNTMPGRAAFQEIVRQEAPDIVLSTHDHLNHAFLEAARAALPARPPRIGTYCGELSGGYGFSKHWVNPRADFFIGATDDCVAQARRLGMPEEKSWTGGFMLNPNFWETPPDASQRAALLSELQLDPAAPFTLLLGTGANGANNHTSLLNAFANFHDTAANSASAIPSIIALCGRNSAAKTAVETWATAHPKIPVRALSYRSDMRSLLASCDAIFARPGTGTTSEAIQSGLPVIFNAIGGIMPQELITVRYCRRFFETNVIHRAATLPEVVSKWQNDPPFLKGIRQAITAAKPKTNPKEILQRLLDGDTGLF
jgi:processive 1,2-diacylglycerol beta-glucosyltransferase